ncbi:MAG: WYL domain-containing protein, partial [Methylococcaceae bacterium]|nr:WYL domain-containing protein [Methylococcaceae bacterium]
RCFALDRIESLTCTDHPATEVDDDQLDAHFGASYGIFGGSPRQTAVLRFTPERARWVAEECWFPGQAGEFEDDGSYRLHLPYSDPTELIMDILKYGPDVEVLEPPELREQVQERLHQALRQYRAGKKSGDKLKI